MGKISIIIDEKPHLLIPELYRLTCCRTTRPTGHLSFCRYSLLGGLPGACAFQLQAPDAKKKVLPRV